MWTRVLWLTVWTTLAFWFGGCGMTTFNGNDAGLVADEQSVIADRAAPASVSVAGLDRSNWEKLAVTPADGRVQHRPAYFTSDNYLKPARSSPLTADGDIVREAELVTADDTGDLTKTDFAQLSLEPIQFAVDMVMFPLRVMIAPPWTMQTSP